jgi:Ketopantoate reductase PanE/ApbA
VFFFEVENMVKSRDGNPIDVSILSHESFRLILKMSLVYRSVAEAADRQYSYVIVTTKAIPDLTKTSKILEPLLSPQYTQFFTQPTYVLLQNGLNVELDLYLAIKEIGNGHPRILSAALWIMTNVLSPVNIVEHDGDYASLRLTQ